MSSLRTLLAIAATYGYFLIFAQFAFLEGLTQSGLGARDLKLVMAAMGVGGVLGCLLTPRLVGDFSPRAILRLAFFSCGVCAVVSLKLTSLAAGLALSATIGLGLGIATVLLSATLGQTVPRPMAGLLIGLGTGIAYAACNVPPLFQSSWQIQSGVAAGMAGFAMLLVPPITMSLVEAPAPSGRLQPFWIIVVLLLALVWLDSAAFYIIQHTKALQKATWSSSHLWRNAGLHLGAALLAGFALDRGHLKTTLFVALALLSLASQFVNHPALAGSGGWLYPLGVSLYSVVLVAYPACFSGARSTAEALSKAAPLFAIAGWIGSALGVGMGQNLHTVPGWFVGVVWALIAGAFCWHFGPRLRPARVSLCILPALFLGALAARDPRLHPAATAVERGREIYLSEGCIHCHSRYVRPGTRDELLWGPAVSLDRLLAERPVLIGNRRVGPDLLEVGLRRSEQWLELHFRDPRSLAPASTMPSYAHLWNDGRGADLVAFLRDNSPEEWNARLATISNWTACGEAGPNGAELFQRHCAVCHGRDGSGDGRLASAFARPPANLRAGPFPFSASPALCEQLARIVKFGIPGTDMPGHESLPDSEVLALADYVRSLRTATTANK